MDQSVIKNVTTQPSLLLGVCNLNGETTCLCGACTLTGDTDESHLMCVVESWAMSCEVNSVQYEVEGGNMKGVLWEGFLKGDNLLEN